MPWSPLAVVAEMCLFKPKRWAFAPLLNKPLGMKGDIPADAAQAGLCPTGSIGAVKVVPNQLDLYHSHTTARCFGGPRKARACSGVVHQAQVLVGLPSKVGGGLCALQGLLARLGAVGYPAVLRVLGRLERLFRHTCTSTVYTLRQLPS